MLKRSRLYLCLFVALSALLAGGCSDSGGSDDDAGTDAGMDAGGDAGGDETPDAGGDETPDAGGDEITDAGGDPGPQTCDEVICDEDCAVYVNVLADPDGDGLTPDTAFQEIQPGIDAAVDLAGECCTCEVQVAGIESDQGGIYYLHTGDPRDSVLLKERVHVLGGYSHDFSYRSIENFETIIDGRDLADGVNHVFHCVTGADGAVIDGFTIRQGRATEDDNDFNPNNYGGGMINLEVSPTVSHCKFTDNQALYGGGLYNSQNAAQITDCAFLNNTATLRGGGMYNAAMAAPLISGSAADACLFESNSSGWFGGGMANVNATPSISQCTFRDNYLNHIHEGDWEVAWWAGGGIYNQDCSPGIADCLFEGNSSFECFDGIGLGAGGALANLRSEPHISGCTFLRNKAAWGGAISNIDKSADDAVIPIAGCTLSENTIDLTCGSDQNLTGGIYSRNVTVEMTQTSLTDNVGIRGGAMYLEDADLNATNCTFERNLASDAGYPYGGAIHHRGAWDDSEGVSHLTLNGCSFVENSAEGYGGGGAVATEAVVLHFSDCFFSKNSAASGGAISAMCKNIVCDRCIFAENVARPEQYSGEGGAYYSNTGADCFSDVHFNDCLFWKNTAGADGGGVYAAWVDLYMTNCTAYGNTGGGLGSVVHSRNNVITTLTNNNFWGNAGASFSEEGSTLQLTYNNMETTHAGVGNMSSDPQFVLPDDADFSNVDLSLQAGSPCIDAGLNAANPAATDLAGNPRIADGDGSGTDEIDLGAYEYQGGKSCD